MKQEKSCGAVVFTHDKGRIEYLLLKHRNGGHWGYAKGHVEEGETEIQTALREIHEETGLCPVLLEGFRYSVAYSPKVDTWKEVIYYAAKSETLEVVVQETEIEEYGWFEYEEALRRLVHENSRQLLSAVHEFIAGKQLPE